MSTHSLGALVLDTASLLPCAKSKQIIHVDQNFQTWTVFFKEMVLPGPIFPEKIGPGPKFLEDQNFHDKPT